MKTKYIYIISFIFISVYTISCRKKNNLLTDNNVQLNFSVDTLLFDTIFPTISSVTKRFTVHNPYKNPIKINNAFLAGGNQSPFRINVDGEAGDEIKDVIIQAEDSIFIFAEVTLDQTNQNNPFIVQDSIGFIVNGNQQFIQLVVWGQDAYFHQNEIISGTLPTDKPHVIYGIAAVGYPGIDSNLTLTIPANTKLFLYNNSSLLVYKSTLNINGTINEPVVFNSTRNKGYYENISGQYNGIRLISSNNSTINYAEIKNANIGIQIDTLLNSGTPSLSITNSKITNSFIANIYANSGAYVIGKNSVFGNSEGYSGAFLNGGRYDFNNCTFANYNYSKSSPTIIIKNYFSNGLTTFVRPIENSVFSNCVFDGVYDDEFDFDIDESTSVTLNINYSSIKTTITPNPTYFNNIFENLITSFVDPENYDYNINSNSELIDKANVATAEVTDINNINRGVTPDLGAYEYN